MSIEDYKNLSEERPDLLRIIDGNVYYSFDYTDYLYNELQKRDNIINELEKIFEEDYKNNQDTTDYPCVYLEKLKELKENK